MKIGFLYHYYEAEQGPFRNLSQLPLNDAQQVLNRLKQKGDVFASRRSDDYLTVRRELEERARTLFISKGGRPEKAYPHYMTLGPCGWLREWYRDGKDFIIPFEEFDPDTISFTYGDLFPTMRVRDGKPYREKVYRKDEIIDLVERLGWPQEWNPDGTRGLERYIEVQIWSDTVIKRYLNAATGGQP